MIRVLTSEEKKEKSKQIFLGRIILGIGKLLPFVKPWVHLVADRWTGKTGHFILRTKYPIFDLKNQSSQELEFRNRD